MANVKLTWTLPTVRKPSNRPLPVDEIAGVEIAASADGGATFAVLDVLPPTVLETIVNELEPGEWFFRAVVVDKAGKRSAPKTGSILVPDESPPGEVPTLTLALVP